MFYVCVCHNLATTTTTTTTQNHLLRSAATTQVGGKGDRHGVVGRIHSGDGDGFSQLDFLAPNPYVKNDKIVIDWEETYLNVIDMYMYTRDLDLYRCHVIVQETGVKIDKV